nr:Conotoxin [Ipomoea batatas]
MCFVLTRCCHVLELIGSKLECVELLASHRVFVPVLPSVRFFCLSAARIQTATMHRRLCAVPNSSSLAVKRSLLAGNGASQSSVVQTMSTSRKKAVLYLMVSMPSFWDAMGLLQNANLGKHL